MTFRKTALFGVLLAGLMSAVAGANAKTLVSTISGGYDLGACCGSTWDTPALFINNSSGGDFTNAQLKLVGYQGDNKGQTATVNLGTIINGASDQLYWGSLPGVSGSTSPFSLTAYDYDDEFAGTKYIIPDPTCGGGGCVAGGGPTWYAQTGNFKVIFTATVSGGAFNGKAVSAAFTPSFNATGHFVGWEGLDANGYSEQSCCDVHNGTVTGDLANIYLGTVTVPEPATWAMLLLGVAGIGGALRSRRRLAIA